MSLSSEIEELSKLFDAGTALSNTANGLQRSMDDFPDIWRKMDELLPSNYEISKEGSISDVCIEFQQWTTSLRAHQDDEVTEFQVMCLGFHRDSVCDEPTYLYGPNFTTLLICHAGRSAVFDPKEVHCLLHRGGKVLLGLRSVKKRAEGGIAGTG